MREDTVIAADCWAEGHGISRRMPSGVYHTVGFVNIFKFIFFVIPTGRRVSDIFSDFCAMFLLLHSSFTVVYVFLLIRLITILHCASDH